MQIQALSEVPEQEYVYYANWRVISGGYMSISISALLISKPKWGEILSVGAFLLSTCVFKTPEMYHDIYNRVRRLTIYSVQIVI